MKLTNGGMCRLYKFYTFLVYVIPMVVLFIIKKDDYIKDGSRFGFWGIVVLMLCVIMFKNFCVEFFKKQRIMTVSVIIFIIGIFSEYLSSQLILIGLVSVIASAVSMAFSLVADVYEQHAFKTDEAGEKIINKNIAISQKEAWREAYGYNFAYVPEENKEDSNIGGNS